MINMALSNLRECHRIHAVNGKRWQAGVGNDAAVIAAAQSYMASKPDLQESADKGCCRSCCPCQEGHGLDHVLFC